MEESRELEFYRYVSVGELAEIERTGKLRGERAGQDETFWTEDFYESAVEARDKLALRRLPQVRVRFTISNEPNISWRRKSVDPEYGQSGGGTEWSSYDAIEVNLPLLEKEVLG